MTTDWSPLRDELALWRAQQRGVPIWWRDDDAIDDTPALRQLTALSEDIGVDVHLAVIPARATPALAELVDHHPCLVPMVHGWAHVNHAPQGQKKAEFNTPRAKATEQTAAALEQLKRLFGARLFPCFVPPWNRIADDVVANLAAQGYLALSTYTPRPARLAAPGLVRVNTHMDPIHWRGGGGLVDPDHQIASMVALLRARRQGDADADEPLGLLTHHLVHDTDIWSFSETCLKVLLDGGAAPVNLNKCNGELP